MFFIPAIMAGCMALFAVAVPPSDGAAHKPAAATTPAKPAPKATAAIAAAPAPARSTPAKPVPPCAQAAAPRQGFTPETLMAALRRAGYGASAMALPRGAPSVSGVIATRIDKADVVILLDRCGKTGTSRTCTVFLSTTFIDDKGLLDPALISRMNGHMVFGKATLKPGAGGHAAFMLSYAVSADVAADPGAIVAALRNFRTDISRAFSVYRSAAERRTR